MAVTGGGKELSASSSYEVGGVSVSFLEVAMPTCGGTNVKTPEFREKDGSKVLSLLSDSASVLLSDVADSCMVLSVGCGATFVDRTVVSWVIVKDAAGGEGLCELSVRLSWTGRFNILMGLDRAEG